MLTYYNRVKRLTSHNIMKNCWMLQQKLFKCVTYLVLTGKVGDSNVVKYRWINLC